MEHGAQNSRPHDTRELVLSPHIRKDTRFDRPILVHELTGSEIASTPDLDAFLDGFARERSQNPRDDLALGCKELPSISDLRKLNFLVPPGIDEERQWVESRDVLKRYRCLASAHFRLYYQGRREITRSYASYLERAYTVLRSRFPLHLKRRATVVLCALEAHFSELWGERPFPEWMKAFAAMGSILVLNIREIGTAIRESPALLSIMMHELVHIALLQNYVRVPIWMEEGLCEYYSRPYSDSRFRRLLKHKKIFGLRELEMLPSNSLLELDDSPGGDNICYRQSHSIVAFMVGLWGESKFLSCIKATGFGPGKSISEIIRNMHLGQLDELEDRWQARYGRVDTTRLSFAADVNCARRNGNIVLTNRKSGASITANMDILAFIRFLCGGKTIREMGQRYHLERLGRDLGLLFRTGFLVCI